MAKAAGDNVFVERLWKTIKYEQVYLHAYAPVSEARTTLTAYFEVYNRRAGAGVRAACRQDHGARRVKSSPASVAGTRNRTLIVLRVRAMKRASGTAANGKGRQCTCSTCSTAIIAARSILVRHRDHAPFNLPRG